MHDGTHEMTDAVETPEVATSDAEKRDLSEKLHALRANVESVFIGKSNAVNQMLVGLIARGHVLVEDVPGVGKTVLARAVARSIDCRFSRMQMTPDLLPSDILGVSVYNDKSGAFEFKHGPIFANIILADEINRTTPRTQSALLEAMNETQVSVDGQAIRLDRPFMVIATQNPFEFEGTYFLPENQLDRFLLRIKIGYPGRDYERRILREQPDRRALESLTPVMKGSDVIRLQSLADRVRVDDVLMDYLQDVVEATRRHDAVQVGVSPRGALALLRGAKALAALHGRDYAIPDDFKELFLPAFSHRLVSKSYLHDGHATSTDQVMLDILEGIPAPS
jgi:MoxR-like ATPase